MKTQAEPRALHSYYIEDMARNYATDCSDPSLEDDEAPCPRDRESPTTTPCYTLEYISASPTGAVPILFKSSSTEQWTQHPVSGPGRLCVLLLRRDSM